jgi:ribosomal protein S27E
MIGKEIDCRICATTLQQLIGPKTQTQTPEHEKSGIYKITCNTCHKAYVGQTGRNLNLRLREHTQYIKNNDPHSAYALHILNCRHEYGNIKDTMTLLKQINKPSLLLPFEQMYIQNFHRNNKLIPEQHPNEHNTMFELLQYTLHPPP